MLKLLVPLLLPDPLLCWSAGGTGLSFPSWWSIMLWGLICGMNRFCPPWSYWVKGWDREENEEGVDALVGVFAALGAAAWGDACCPVLAALAC